MSADLNQLLSRFAATGLESSFHERHINPQIMSGLNGHNWRLKDYEARGGYQGKIAVTMKDLGETIAITIEDNGIGLPADRERGRAECRHRDLPDPGLRDALGRSDPGRGGGAGVQ